MDASEHAADDRALVLAGPVTTATAPATRQRMLELLSRAPACVIHAREVTQLDAAGAQLLHAFLIEAARRGTPVTWVDASVFVVEAARMLGMEDCLGLSGLSKEATSWQP